MGTVTLTFCSQYTQLLFNLYGNSHSYVLFTIHPASVYSMGTVTLTFCSQYTQLLFNLYGNSHSYVLFTIHPASVYSLWEQSLLRSVHNTPSFYLISMGTVTLTFCSQYTQLLFNLYGNSHSYVLFTIHPASV